MDTGLTLCKAVNIQLTPFKGETEMNHYFVLANNENGEILLVTKNGFSELTLAIEYLEMIPKWMNPFICVRLINI